jgi:phenylalanyl-tRNA synthetase alpha subunit
MDDWRVTTGTALSIFRIDIRDLTHSCEFNALDSKSKSKNASQALTAMLTTPIRDIGCLSVIDGEHKRKCISRNRF